MDTRRGCCVERSRWCGWAGCAGLSAPLSLAFPGVNRLEREMSVGAEWV